MNRLELPTKPVFPLEIYREPATREAWVNAGRTSFKVFWPGGVALCKMTDAAKIVKNGRKTVLRIEAVPVAPVAEVWGADGRLCHLWFQVGEAVYEATHLNGWKPKAGSAPKSVGRPSEDALNLAVALSEKVAA